MNVRFWGSSKMIVAGTGHRPKYCPCKYKKKHPWLDNLRGRLKFYLKSLDATSKHGIIVRAGGAIGWDTWLANAALELGLELHLYLPFPDQGSQWPTDSRTEYERIKELADKVNFTSDKYYPKVFLHRDLEMITGSDQVVSLLNPEVSSGGTFYTVQEAKKLDIDVINFWKNEDELGQEELA